MMRLQKFLALSDVASRRMAEKMIADGRVSVNHKTVTEMGVQVDEIADIVEVDGKPVHIREDKHYIAYNKPIGEVTTVSDPEGRATVMDRFRDYPARLYPVGRLDKDSEGLLLMSNDGVLIDAMMRGANGHEKEYIVRVKSRITDADLERMRKGVRLRDLDVTTRPCRVERLGDFTFRIILTQGLNRQIRRMCRAVGNEVKKLKRVRVLNIELGSMKPGEMREITGSEFEELYRIAGCSTE